MMESCYADLPETGEDRAVRNRRLRAAAEQRAARRKQERLEKRRQDELASAVMRARIASNRKRDRARISEEYFYERKFDRRYRKKINRLLSALQARSPQLLRLDHGDALVRLLRRSWCREPGDWRPTTRDPLASLLSLSAHLLAVYPVPAFLVKALIVSDDADSRRPGTAQLFDHLAQGGSMRKAVDLGLVPYPLTRRMCHLFVNTRAHLSVRDALLRALILGHGGSGWLFQAALRAGFPDKPFRSSRLSSDLIRWLAVQPGLRPGQLKPIIDYLDHRYRHEGDFVFAGLTLKSLTDEMHAWYGDDSSMPVCYTFRPSGLSAGAWTVEAGPGRGADQRVVWTMQEILGHRDLVQEGRAMRHCVANYAGSVSHCNNSIWSLRYNNARALTVMVNAKDRAIVEACGKCNRAPKTREIDILKTWAVDNRLEMPDWCDL
ncbi:MAG: PcfJ domain-containing protein [bacterium]|nr:PcfJ domain-containing protein [bacterium]